MYIYSLKVVTCQKLLLTLMLLPAATTFTSMTTSSPPSTATPAITIAGAWSFPHGSLTIKDCLCILLKPKQASSTLRFGHDAAHSAIELLHCYNTLLLLLAATTVTPTTTTAPATSATPVATTAGAQSLPPAILIVELCSFTCVTIAQNNSNLVNGTGNDKNPTGSQSQC